MDQRQIGSSLSLCDVPGRTHSECLSAVANGPPRLRRAFLAIHSDGLFCLYLGPPCRHLAPARCRTCRLSFPKFCARILDALHANGGEMKRRDVLRLLGRKQRNGIELERALAQLKKEERINFLERSPRYWWHYIHRHPHTDFIFGQTL